MNLLVFEDIYDLEGAADSFADEEGPGKATAIFECRRFVLQNSLSMRLHKMIIGINIAFIFDLFEFALIDQIIIIARTMKLDM